MQIRPSIGILTVSLALATVTSAGPVWEEGNKDAGPQLLDARPVSLGYPQSTLGPGGSVTTLVGKTAFPPTPGTCSTGGGPPGLLPGDDPIDLFEVVFPSTTGWTISCDPGWDVELFLFEEYTLGGWSLGYNLIGAADDTPVPGCPWCLDEGASISASQVTVNLSRRHFVAVAGKGAVPGRYVNNIWQPCIINQPTNWTGVLAGGSGRYFEDWEGYVEARGPYEVQVDFAPMYADDCVTATSLLPGLNSFSTVDATNSTTPLPSGCSNLKKDVWFVFVPPCKSGHFLITTCGHAAFDTVLAAYNIHASDCSSIDANTASWCNDDACAGLQSELSFDVQWCDQLLVRVGGYNGASGSGDLELMFVPDFGSDCDCRVPITMGSTPFNNDGPNDTPLSDVDLTGYCNPGPFGTDIIYSAQWFEFTPTQSGTFAVSTCNQASFDTRLAVLTSCDASSVVACNDDGDGCSGYSSYLTFEAECGMTYFIIVGGYSASTPLGSGTLSISTTNGVPCCPSGQVRDCNGNCCPASWVGDGNCDDGSYTWNGVPIYLNCARFGNDGGDCPNPTGDLNADGVVNGADLALMLSSWGTAGADINGDGLTDGNDLTLLLSNWAG